MIRRSRSRLRSRCWPRSRSRRRLYVNVPSGVGLREQSVANVVRIARSYRSRRSCPTACRSGLYTYVTVGSPRLGSGLFVRRSVAEVVGVRRRLAAEIRVTCRCQRVVGERLELTERQRSLRLAVRRSYSYVVVWPFASVTDVQVPVGVVRVVGDVPQRIGHRRELTLVVVPVERRRAGLVGRLAIRRRGRRTCRCVDVPSG